MSTLAFMKKKLPLEVVRLEVDRIATIIGNVVRPYAIYVFGSAAEDSMSDQSDIDLLIILTSPLEINPARKAIAKIRPFSEFPLDLVWMTRDDFVRKSAIGGLAQIVAEDGRLVFGSKP
jgi:predicted nucleotidyltransferase